MRDDNRSTPVRTGTHGYELLPAELREILELPATTGRVVGGVLPKDKEPDRRWKRPGRINKTMPVRVVYRPMFERHYETRRLSGLEREGWTVDA